MRFVQEKTGLEILYAGEVIQYLLRKGFNRRFGARPLRNTMETESSLSANYYHSDYEALAAGERVTVPVSMMEEP